VGKDAHGEWWEAGNSSPKEKAPILEAFTLEPSTTL